MQDDSQTPDRLAAEFGLRLEDAARSAYEAYTDSSGGLNFLGQPCPEWGVLPEQIRRNWEAAARRVLALIEEQLRDQAAAECE
jgi:hypothetical protein